MPKRNVFSLSLVMVVFCAALLASAVFAFNDLSQIDTDADRFVTPTHAPLPSTATRLYLVAPTLDDASAITVEVAPYLHARNYPMPGMNAGKLFTPDYDAGQILYEWTFDDADGTTISSQVNSTNLYPTYASGSAVTYTFAEQGDPTFQATAATAGLGNGVTFDGTGDAFDRLAANMNNGSQCVTTGDFTVEVVCKLTNAAGGAGDTIIGCRVGADGVGWQLQLDGNEYLDVHIEDADGQVAQEGATDICTDAVVHIVCSFDRDGNLVTYLDGASNATTDISSKEKTLYDSAAYMSIGGDAARTAGDCLTGDIYFARIYGRALSAAEVANNYAILTNKGWPGWSPLLDPADGDDLAVVKSGSTPGVFDLSDYIGLFKRSAFRAVCATEQTTTPVDLNFYWVWE